MKQQLLKVLSLYKLIDNGVKYSRWSAERCGDTSHSVSALTRHGNRSNSHEGYSTPYVTHLNVCMFYALHKKISESLWNDPLCNLWMSYIEVQSRVVMYGSSVYHLVNLGFFFTAGNVHTVKQTYSGVSSYSGTNVHYCILTLVQTTNERCKYVQRNQFLIWQERTDNSRYLFLCIT